MDPTLVLTAIAGTAIGALAVVTNLRDAGTAPPRVRTLRRITAGTAALATCWYLGTLFGVVEPAAHGPYLFRPIALMLLTLLAAEPLARRRG